MSPHFIVVPWSLWLLELLGCNIDEESKIISITSINNQWTPGHELRIMLQYRDHLWLHQMSWRSWFYFAKICVMYISPIINFWLLNDWGMKNSGPSLKNLFTKNNNYKITPCLQHSLRQSRRKNWNIFLFQHKGSDKDLESEIHGNERIQFAKFSQFSWVREALEKRR